MEWDPSRFFRVSEGSSAYALLVLNQPINERAFEVLSGHASHIICADGGANRLYDMKSNEDSTELPDTIVGDLDSLHPSVRQHYEKLGVTILQDPDQYSTDFTKCLVYINKHAAEIIASPRCSKKSSAKTQDQDVDSKSCQSNQSSTLDVVILGGLGGRVDQAFSQIHHLYMMTQKQRELCESNRDETSESQKATGGNLYLISEESITFVLQRGRNTIHTPATNRPEGSPSPSEAQSGVSRKRKRQGDSEPEYFFEENIGIIPLSAPATITTRGFEWDVQDWHTEIGGQISTSNHIRADQVEVETSVPVLFTVELAQRFKRA